jgi:hypothetical protein
LGGHAGEVRHILDDHVKWHRSRIADEVIA